MVDRMKAMDAARSEVSKLIARDRLKKAVKSNVPAAADKVIQIGEQVLVYKEKPINQWIGPFHVRDVSAKTVFVNMNGRRSQLSIDKVKVYVKPETGEDEEELSSIRTLSPAQDSLEEMFRDGPLEELFRSPRADEDPISTKEFFVGFQSYLTEVIDSTNPISKSERFQKAKEQEVQGLNSRGTWEIVKKSDVSTGANILGGRFVLALRNVSTENEQAKARFVAQGFANKEKDFLIHNVMSLRQSSVRVLLSFAANNGYRMYSHDVRQAYTQSAEPLTREIYLQPKRNDVHFFGIQEDEVLKYLTS